MPSNVDLIKEIKDLDTEAEIEGLKNKQLVILLKELKQPVDGHTTAEPEVKVDVYCVKQGGAITTKRGILANGDEICARDLPGGGEAMTAFIQSGHIVKS